MAVLRGILGVVFAYITIAIVLFALFTVAWLILGPDGSYKPDSWEVSNTWLIMSFVVSLIAAIVAGLVCRLIARSMTAVWVFVALVVVLGAAQAAFTLTSDDETEKQPRPDDVTMMDAMSNAEQPMSAHILNPIIGAVGVLIGASLRGDAKPPTEPSHS